MAVQRTTEEVPCGAHHGDVEGRGVLAVAAALGLSGDRRDGVARCRAQGDLDGLVEVHLRGGVGLVLNEGEHRVEQNLQYLLVGGVSSNWSQDRPDDSAHQRGLTARPRERVQHDEAIRGRLPRVHELLQPVRGAGVPDAVVDGAHPAQRSTGRAGRLVVSVVTIFARRSSRRGIGSNISTHQCRSGDCHGGGNAYNPPNCIGWLCFRTV